MNVRDKIQAWLDETVQELKANYHSLGLAASGNWEKELETKIEEKGSGFRAIILGAFYTGMLESGRKPNTNQSPEALRAFVGWAGSTILKDWVQRKGLTINPYAVAYKIARKGIKVPNSHNPGGIISNVITDDRIDKLLDDIMEYIITDVQSDVLSTLKKK